MVLDACFTLRGQNNINSVWTGLLLPLCDQARPWFQFFKRTSSVAGLALCLVAFSRASLVVLFCGENGTAVLSTEL